MRQDDVNVTRSEAGADALAARVPAGRAGQAGDGSAVLIAQAQGGVITQPQPLPSPGAPAPRIVRLPAGTSLDNIEFRGDDIVLNQPAGATPIVIPDGVRQPPTLFVGDIEIPAATLAAAFSQAGIVPGAGPAGAQPGAPGSSGGNFAVEPGDIGQAFGLTALLDPTALTTPTLEERELAPFEARGSAGPNVAGVAALTLDEAALPAGSSPGATTATATLGFGAGAAPITQFAFGTDLSGLRASLGGASGANIVWERVSASEIVGRINGAPAVTLTLAAPAGVAPGSTGTVTITAQLLAPLNGPDGGGAQRLDLGSIAVEATTALGVASAAASISVIDDVPGARDLIVGGVIPEGSPAQLLGPAVAVLGISGGADGLAGITFAAGSLGGRLAIDGVSGQLVYTPPSAVTHVNGAARAESFSYTVLDTDGDLVTRTVTLSLGDSGVEGLIATPAVADEDDLPAGRGDTAPGDDGSVLTGTIGYVVGPDGLGGVSLSAPAIGFTKLDGGTIVATWDAASRTLTGHAAGDVSDVVFTLVLGAPTVGATPYTFTLVQPVRHAGSTPGFEDNVALAVDVTVSDGDGSTLTQPGALQIVIDDDVPEAVSDAANGGAATPFTPVNYNLGLVLDFSTSVDNPNVTAMVTGVREAVRSYFDNASGSVLVTMVAFGGSAVGSGPFNSFAAFDAQLTAWETVRPVPNPTNYTRAIQAFIASYVPLPGFENQVLFVSDGRSNTMNGPGDTPLQPATAAAWNSFVAGNDLDVTSVAVGSVTSLRKLRLIDVDGVGDPIRIEQLDRLVESTITADNPAIVTGNVLANDLGGADGIGGVTAVGSGAADPTQAAGSVVAGLYGSITIAADGSYSYTIDGANAAVRTLAPNAELLDRFTYRMTDGDGDGATATLAICIQGSNGAPVAAGSIILALSEAALDTTADGDDLAAGLVTGNAPASTAESDRGGSGTGELRIVAPSNEALASVAFAAPVGADAPVTSGLATGYAMSWSLDAGGRLIGSLTGPGGVDLGPSVLIALSAPIAGTLGEIVTPVLTATLINALPHAPGTASIQFGGIRIEAVDTNGDRASGVAAVTVADDAPLAFTPDMLRPVNAGGTSLTGDLDTTGAARDSIGADGLGTSGITSLRSGGVTHTADASDSLLSFLGRPVLLYGFGTATLIGSIDTNPSDGLDPGLTVFRLTLDAASDTYRLDLNGMIDEGQAGGLAGLDLLRPGEIVFNGVNIPGASGDVLFSAFTADATGRYQATARIGGTAAQLGVNGAALDDGEVLGINFVNDLRLGVGVNNSYTYNNHSRVSGAAFTVGDGTGGTAAGSVELWIRAYDAANDDPSGTSSDAHHREITPQRDITLPVDPQDAITTILINGAAVDVSTLVTDGRGGYLVTGLSVGDRLDVATRDGFNRLEIENPGGATGSGLEGESVSIGDLSFIQASPGRDFRITAGVQIGDGDGDIAASAINIDFSRAARPNTVASGPGDDTIYGGAGADTLSGGGGSDTFMLEAGQLANGLTVPDLIVDYNAGEGDRLDLTALLNSLGANRPTTAAEVDSVVNLAGADLQIDNNGLASGGDMVTVASFAASAIPSSVLVVFSETQAPATVS